MYKLVGINSLRFFAIVFIVIYHLFPDFLPGGFIAVETFFVLSGFLISTKLIRELKKVGKLRYFEFIKSRFKRLFPSLLLCVLICLAIGVFVEPDILTGARRNSLTALSFTSSIAELVTGGSYENTILPNLFENTWFLALLFQMYLLLPLLLKLFLNVFASQKNAIRFYGIALTILGISSLLLMICFGGFFDLSDRAYFALDSHMAAFCFGAAFAVYNYFKPRAPRTKKAMPAVGLFISFAAITAMAFLLDYQNPWSFIIGLPLTGVLSVVEIVCIIRLQHNFRSRRKTMNLIRVFESLGELSFGVYLFHWPLRVLLPQLLPSDTAAWGYAIIDIILSFALADFVYRLVSIKDIRKKFMRLRPFERCCVATVILTFVSAATISLIRAPQASSIAEQLSSEANKNTEELYEQTAHERDFIAAAQMLDRTTNILDLQIQLAKDSELTIAPNTSLAAPNANEARVLVIGDSVTLGAKEAIEATIAKSFVDAKENRGIETATGILAGYSANGRLPNVIVISLATNQRTITDAILQDIKNVAGENHRFILVTAYAGPMQPRDTQNATLRDFANSHDDVYLADWWEIAHDNWSLMYADHIHLNPSGRSAYATMLNNVIKGMR